MVDLKLQVPATEEVEVDAETLAAIDLGIKAADEGRTVSLDEVRGMIPKWLSRFESQTRRWPISRSSSNIRGPTSRRPPNVLATLSSTTPATLPHGRGSESGLRAFKHLPSRARSM